MITTSQKDACVFLAEYAAWLLGCGATCIRIEKNVGRMSESFNLVSELSIMPSYVILTVWDKEHLESYTAMNRIRRCGISFHINTLLSQLSWQVSDQKLSYVEAMKSMQEIVHTPPEKKWVVLLLASLANASFCRLFGGDLISMLLVFLATMAGYRLKQIMLEDKYDIRLVFFCCAFVASVISAGGHIFGWGNTPDVALATSVLYLIPGIPYINSVSDMLDGHYLCSFSRFIDAVVLTACLSMGLCGGLLLMDLKWF